MEQDKFEIWMMEYLSGELNLDGEREFEKFLKDNAIYQEQFDVLNHTWQQIDGLEIPEASEKMDAVFSDMLYENIEKQKKTEGNWLAGLQSFFGSLQKPQIVFGMLLLGVGLIVGYLLRTTSPNGEIKETIVSNSETEEIREQLVLTLLEQPSANKRLQAVNEASKLNDATERVIEALFATLNNDSNINVRLAAIESLTKYVETPEVRMGLVKSIGFQDSPLVQIALADLMVALQEKTSIESMKELLKQPDIDTTVKQKIEESINHII